LVAVPTAEIRLRTAVNRLNLKKPKRHEENSHPDSGRIIPDTGFRSEK
jgi:hypothetical protein